jgi:hypothetical protein
MATSWRPSFNAWARRQTVSKAEAAGQDVRGWAVGLSKMLSADPGRTSRPGPLAAWFCRVLHVGACRARMASWNCAWRSPSELEKRHGSAATSVPKKPVHTVSRAFRSALHLLRSGSPAARSNCGRSMHELSEQRHCCGHAEAASWSASGALFFRKLCNAPYPSGIPRHSEPRYEHHHASCRDDFSASRCA